MTKMEIPKILEDARTFAREYHTRKPFKGYTEAEVMKGFTALAILLNHFIMPGIKFETTEEAQPYFDTLKAAGIDIKNDSWKKAGEVFEIMTQILCADKEDTDNEN